jgi:hypothetical protein
MRSSKDEEDKSHPKELERGAGGMRPVRDAMTIARHEVPGLGHREREESRRDD